MTTAVAAKQWGRRHPRRRAPAALREEYPCARRAGGVDEPAAGCRSCSGRAPTSESSPVAVTSRLDRRGLFVSAAPPTAPKPSGAILIGVASRHGRITAAVAPAKLGCQPGSWPASLGDRQT